MTKRAAPRWVAAFLRALARCGEVRAAARDAAIDHSTAYARRAAHGAFAADWAAALDQYRARRAGEAASDVAAARTAGAHIGRGEQRLIRTAGGPQLRRVGAGRWSAAAERTFFAALAEGVNVRAAADAAGFSTAAIYARRLRHAPFREQWAALIDSARARLDLALVSAANAALERGAAAAPAGAATVSVAEALQILRLGAEPRSPVGLDGARRLIAGARARVAVASEAEIVAALTDRLSKFALRQPGLQPQDDPHRPGCAGRPDGGDEL